MNLQKFKSNFETEKEQQNQARLNLETLLHQEQVILSNLKDEYSLLKEEYELQKNEATQKRSDEQKLIVIGDMNLDYLSENSDVKALKVLLASKQLQQKIVGPTHNLRNCIDHIYTNIENCICGVSETYFSDHKAVWLALHP